LKPGLSTSLRHLFAGIGVNELNGDFSPTILYMLNRRSVLALGHRNTSDAHISDLIFAVLIAVLMVEVVLDQEVRIVHPSNRGTCYVARPLIYVCFVAFARVLSRDLHY